MHTTNSKPQELAELIPVWLEKKFAGRTIQELRKACKHLRVNTSSNDSLATLTRRLLDHFGKWDQTPTTAAVQSRGLRMPPQLRTLNGWAGKRMRIRALPQSKEMGGNRAFPAMWEAETVWIDPKLKFQDVPFPIYHNLRDCESQELNTEWDPEAKVTRKWWTAFNRYPIELVGVTPGDENKPESLRDWYISDARSHEMYANEDYDSLERVWANLTDRAHPNKEDRDRTIDYWRYEVLQLLGLTPEQLPAVEEVEEDMTA